jgi:hypothetical protein
MASALKGLGSLFSAGSKNADAVSNVAKLSKTGAKPATTVSTQISKSAKFGNWIKANPKTVAAIGGATAATTGISIAVADKMAKNPGMTFDEALAEVLEEVGEDVGGIAGGAAKGLLGGVGDALGLEIDPEIILIIIIGIVAFIVIMILIK